MQYRLLALVFVIGCGSSPSTASSATPTPTPDAGAAMDSGSQLPSGTYAPQGITIGDSRVTEVRFVDAQKGFLLLAGDTPESRGVWTTNDGGASWSHREIDIVPGGIGFTPDLAHLWVAGTSSQSNLWSSTDDGQSFAPLPWTLDAPGRVAFVDASTVLVAEQLGNAVWRTTDSGASWSTSDFDSMYAALNMSVVGQDVWLAGGLSFQRSGAQVTHSADGGATWSAQSLTDNAHTFEGGQLQAIHAATATDVWVAGDNRQLFHTTDGATFTQITGIPESFDQLGGIAVSGSRITVAGSSANGYALYESDDGGASFHMADEIRCPSACGDVIGIESPAPGVMFVYGDGLLWRVAR